MKHLLATSLMSCAVIGSVSAQTATTTFDVQITIEAECLIESASDLDFGTAGVIDANVDETSTIAVQCTDGTPYTVGLGPGLGGGTIDERVMTGPGGATVDYNLYQDPARTVVWGEAIGTNTVAGTGDGAIQNLTVYGRVPPQETPAAGTYTDTVTVTVSY